MIEIGLWHVLLGNLSWGALPFVRAWRDPSISEIIGAGAGAVVVIGVVAVFTLVTYLRKWRYLWTEWFTSLDPQGSPHFLLCSLNRILRRKRFDL